MSELNIREEEKRKLRELNEKLQQQSEHIRELQKHIDALLHGEADTKKAFLEPAEQNQVHRRTVAVLDTIGNLEVDKNLRVTNETYLNPFPACHNLYTDDGADFRM
jgi:hypothetical protein